MKYGDSPSDYLNWENGFLNENSFQSSSEEWFMQNAFLRSLVKGPWTRKTICIENKFSSSIWNIYIYMH